MNMYGNELSLTEYMGYQKHYAVHYPWLFIQSTIHKPYNLETVTPSHAHR